MRKRIGRVLCRLSNPKMLKTKKELMNFGREKKGESMFDFFQKQERGVLHSSLVVQHTKSSLVPFNILLFLPKKVLAVLVKYRIRVIFVAFANGRFQRTIG